MLLISLRTSYPETFAVPNVGPKYPHSIFMVVLFPAPLGLYNKYKTHELEWNLHFVSGRVHSYPRNPKVSPSATVKVKL